MSYKALYRTYRPIDFTEVAGQNHITTTLKNALTSGKVAHAYLFSGPRGTGKTSIAKILAKAVNCEKAPIANPCNVCPNCLGIQDGTISDVIEIDAASNNGVDEIREIRDKVKYLPGYVKYKVYIIDEVHMLSTGAFNALLKTLEEPPAHVIFILCTTEPQKIPLTIHSRCQRFDFKAITPVEIAGKMKEVIAKEHINIEEAAVNQIAIFADGGLRDALSLLDQTYSFSPEMITLDDVNQICGAVSFSKQMEIVHEIWQMDSAQAIKALDELIASGKDVAKICQNMIQFYRDVLVYKNVGFADSLSVLSKNEEFISITKALSNRRIFFYLDILNKAANDIRWSNNPRLYLELAFIKMTDEEPESDAKVAREMNELENRLEKLEKGALVESAPQKSTKTIDSTASSRIHTKKQEKDTTSGNAPIDQTEKEPETAISDTINFVPESVEKPANDTQTAPESACVDISKTYDIGFIEDVLNNGNRNDKAFLINNWHLFSKNASAASGAQVAQIFAAGTLMASSFGRIIVTFKGAGACNKLMAPSAKAVVKDVLKQSFDRDIDYMALPEEVFKAISEEFAVLYRQGRRNIKLSPIVCPDLRDVSADTDEKATPKIEKVVADAIDLFGDLVKVKR
ncbi:MAG: DNA polymerase III subunit gamma/tau [Candidatus Izemoplasmatales bacterium]